VCSDVRRADIDKRLSFQIVNMRELSRDLGISRDSLTAHRKNHLPQFLGAFQASASALTLGTLQAEAQRLYEVTLDALASAEAGTLMDVDKDGVPMRVVSHTAIARFIREARAGLGLLAKLSADAGSEADRPTGVSNGELDGRISTALGQVMERALSRSPIARASADTTNEINGNGTKVEGQDGRTALTPGASMLKAGAGATPATDPPSPPTHVLQFSATPNPEARNESDISPSQEAVAQADLLAALELADRIAGRPASGSARTADNPNVRAPDWPGSPAASKEERAAAGYADIPIQDVPVGPSDAILDEQIRLASIRVEAARRERFESAEVQIHEVP
jgi:hypothetical protein